MKPFLFPESVEVIYDGNGYPSGIRFNGFNLMIDLSIFPRKKEDMERILIAAYRYTSILCTLPLEFPKGMVLKITGFTSYANFKIEPTLPIYMNGYPFQTIYIEEHGRPSIITK